MHIELPSTISHPKKQWHFVLSAKNAELLVTATIEASNSGNNIHYSTDNNLTTLYISKCHIFFCVCVCVCAICHTSRNGELLKPTLLAVLLEILLNVGNNGAANGDTKWNIKCVAESGRKFIPVCCCP